MKRMLMMLGLLALGFPGVAMGEEAAEQKSATRVAYEAAADGDMEALARLQRAAEGGHGEAQYCLGLLYIKGFGVEKNFAEAEKWVTLSGENGFLQAQKDLALWYQYGRGRDSFRIEVEPNNTKSLYWYKKAAESGDAWAMWDLARVYSDGKITLTNPGKAVEWTRRSAEAGNSLAWAELSTIYETGKYGVEKDPKEARRIRYFLAENGDTSWVRQKAKMHNDKEAQLVMAWLCENGTAKLKKEPEEARKWYAKIGALDLGKFYLEGHGKYAEQNFQKAIECFEQAVQLGSIDAQCLLAEAYEKEKNLEQARKWYLESARNGDSVALAMLKKNYAEGDAELQAEITKLEADHKDPVMIAEWKAVREEGNQKYVVATQKAARPKIDTETNLTFGMTRATSARLAANRAAKTRIVTTRPATAQSTTAQATTAQATTTQADAKSSATTKKEAAQKQSKASATTKAATQEQTEEQKKGEAKFQEGQALMLRAKGFVKGDGMHMKRVQRASQISDEQKSQYYTDAIKCFQEASDLGHAKAATELKAAQKKLESLKK